MEFKNFKLIEFSCRCCGANYISKGLLTQLQNAQTKAQIPFIITSGYRCENHNKNVGGSSNSNHLKGLACDIKYKTIMNFL